jgi:hypothetical protein
MFMNPTIRGQKTLRAGLRSFRRNQTRPRVELLEDRTVLSPYIVKTTADTGAGSLREAINQIKGDTSHSLYSSPTNARVDEIDFQIPWNSPGHFYYKDDGIAGHLTAADIAPVPTIAIDGVTSITTDAQLSDPTMVGGNTIDPDRARSWWSIALQSGLPEITNSAIIDASTQRGYAGAPIVVLDGTNAGIISSLGITATAAGSTVKGLMIDNIGLNSDNNVIANNYIGTDGANPNFSPRSDGVNLFDSSWNTITGNVIVGAPTGIWAGGTPGLGCNNNVIQGNYIGLNATGTTILTPFNDQFGIWFIDDANSNTIGGTGNGQGNVISGYTVDVYLEDNVSAARTTGNIIEGNYIGTDATGEKALASSNNYESIGVFLQENSPAANIIGGTVAGAGNLISGFSGPNSAAGNEIVGNGDQVEGNRIGTDATGTKPLPNANGIFVGGPATIGGTGQGAGNIIAYNQGSGISVGGTGSRIEGNSIYANGQLGIDLVGNDLPLLNDSLGHVGANNFQDFPVLGVAEAGSVTTITGTFTEAAEPNTTLTLDFYANSAADPSGYGQGQRYLGSAQVATDSTGNLTSSPDGSAIILVDAAGNKHFVFNLGAATSAGEFISATATDLPNAVL